MRALKHHDRADRRAAAEAGAVGAAVVLLLWHVAHAVPALRSSLEIPVMTWLPAAAGALGLCGAWLSAGRWRLPPREINLHLAMATPPATMIVEALTFPHRLHVPAVVSAQAAVVIILCAMLWLHAGLRQLEADTIALDQLASRDHLTGLLVRAAADETLDRRMIQSFRDDLPLSIALLDLDHFKRYNDTHGHPAGDALLRDAAQAWTARLSDGDVLARYGGEEFLLITNHETPEAELVLTRMRNDTPYQQSFSAGLVAWDLQESASNLLARADAALYRAKAEGRARTVRIPAGAAVTTG